MNRIAEMLEVGQLATRAAGNKLKSGLRAATKRSSGEMRRSALRFSVSFSKPSLICRSQAPRYYCVSRTYCVCFIIRIVKTKIHITFNRVDSRHQLNIPNLNAPKNTFFFFLVVYSTFQTRYISKKQK